MPVLGLMSHDVSVEFRPPEPQNQVVQDTAPREAWPPSHHVQEETEPLPIHSTNITEQPFNYIPLRILRGSVLQAPNNLTPPPLCVMESQRNTYPGPTSVSRIPATRNLQSYSQLMYTFTTRQMQVALATARANSDTSILSTSSSSTSGTQPTD